MATSKLEWVAQDMRAEVARHGGHARRELVRGLRLDLSAEEPGWWILHLSRPATTPGEQEIEIVRAAFGVPEDAQIDDYGIGMSIRWRP